MKAAGIIVEYNPFHNGHAYHINKTRELSDADVLIACSSGDFNQRGDVSIINKYEKTKAALEHGVDLVVELPFIYTLQNAYVFGKKAVEILNRLKISDLVFGSETNNLEELKKYSELEVDVTRLKELMHDGSSFPKAYGLLSGSLYPNDMLGVAYLKALKDTDINPISIQRTNDYHSEDMKVIASATAIRKAIKEGRDISMATDLFINDPVFNDELYPYLRTLLFTMSKEDLQKIFLVDEGIENLLKEKAILHNNYEDFVNDCVSRRYTRSRIQRVMIMIAAQIKKDEVKDLRDNDYVRVLGFNEKGRQYIRELKEEVNFVTLFKNIPEPYKDMEWRASLLYASLLKDPDAYIRRILKEPVII